MLTTEREQAAILDYLGAHESRRHVTFELTRTGSRVMAFTDSMMRWLISRDNMSHKGTRVVRI